MTGQQQRDLWRGVGDVAWDAGPGTVSFLLRHGAAGPAGIAVGGWLDPHENRAKARLDAWGGGRTDTTTNRSTYATLSVAVIFIPGPSGKARVAEEAAQAVPRLLYRGGSRTPLNMTPRPGIDHTGLSTFDSPAAAAPNGGKVQVIDTSRLLCTVACPDAPPPGHVSIRPANGGSIADWAATRGGSETSLFTQDILDAVVDEIRIPKR